MNKHNTAAIASSTDPATTSISLPRIHRDDAAIQYTYTAAMWRGSTTLVADLNFATLKCRRISSRRRDALACPLSGCASGTNVYTRTGRQDYIVVVPAKETMKLSHNNF